MKIVSRWLMVALGIFVLWGGLWAVVNVQPGQASADPQPATPCHRTPLPGPPLPRRASATPTNTALEMPSPTPIMPCTRVFAIERVEELLEHSTTIPQLEAAFGRSVSSKGRASRLRFVAGGCTLMVTPGDTAGSAVVQEAELVDYGSIGWLLERYGDPAAIGVTQGNHVMPLTGYSVLLYPERGVIALVASDPQALRPEMPLWSLLFRAPFALDAQVRRMNLELVDE